MKGLSSGARDTIEALVDGMFDRMALNLLGNIPALKGKKTIAFTANPQYTLATLFVQSLGQTKPLPNEQDVLKGLILTAYNYIQALRSKTKASLMENVEAYVKEQRAKNQTPNSIEVKKKIQESMDKAKNHFKLIAEAETTKARNMGKIMNIARVGASMGESDPSCFFIVIRDGVTCSECKRLHLMPDGITPRVWKLSELGFNYHKKGENSPKIAGLHPNCFTENMKLHTSEGLFTFKELFDSKKFTKVCVDNRVINKKIPANQFGVEVPGEARLERHNSGTRFLQATNVFDTGVQECFEIELDSGHKIEVSAGHEMWVDDEKSGKKISAKDLKVGDKIPLVSGASGFGKDSFEDIAELMGHVLGDGLMGKDTANFIFFDKDIDYGKKLLEKARKVLTERNELAALSKISKELIVKKENKKYKVKRACFNSTVLRRIFKEEFGLDKKPRRVPARIWKADEKTVASFLRGLYSADGHPEKTSVVLCQNDIEFLREIQILLSNFGIISRIHEHGKETEKTITYANGDSFLTKRKACWRLIIGGSEQCEMFMDTIGFGVEEKTKKLKEFLSNKNENKIRFFWRTSRVKSIKPIGQKQTYCLSEPMTNTLTVNGIVTGNCRCSLTMLSPGFGFRNGSVAYIGTDHDELKKQRE